MKKEMIKEIKEFLKSRNYLKYDESYDAYVFELKPAIDIKAKLKYTFASEQDSSNYTHSDILEYEMSEKNILVEWLVREYMKTPNKYKRKRSIPFDINDVTDYIQESVLLRISI